MIAQTPATYDGHAWSSDHSTRCECWVTSSTASHRDTDARAGRARTIARAQAQSLAALTMPLGIQREGDDPLDALLTAAQAVLTQHARGDAATPAHFSHDLARAVGALRSALTPFTFPDDDREAQS